MKHKKTIIIASIVIILLIIVFAFTRQKSRKPAEADIKNPLAPLEDSLKSDTDPLHLADPKATINGLTRADYLKKGVSQRDIDIMFS